MASAEVLERAAALGVAAFVAKEGSLATLIQTPRDARTGSMITDPALLARLTAFRQQQAAGPQVPSLTQREMGVLRLMATGTDVRTNARTLGISTQTCRGYTKSILSKLGATPSWRRSSPPPARACCPGNSHEIPAAAIYNSERRLGNRIIR